MKAYNRRLYLNNWAILVDEKSQEVMWYYGDIAEPKITQTIDFIQALSKLGTEIYSETIGIIRLKYPRPHPTKAKEIMLVNLLDRYHFVISDPLVTTRLIQKVQVIESDSIPHLDEIRSILAGSASVIYSEFYTHEKQLDPKVVDSLFQEALEAVTLDQEKVSVGNGECSFSALTLEELLFFHALLKKIFESYVYISRDDRPWGLLHSISGAQIYLEYDPVVDSALISAFSSVIVTYCRLLFGGDPERLVYGSHSISGMDFITTTDNIFVTNNPRRLLHLEKFIRQWKKVPPTVITDLAPAMKDYFVDLVVTEHREKLKKLELQQIINRLTKMGIRRANAYKLPVNE
ncbi:hypothetical protein [Candidatus Hodarchaeum mangrovi]